MDNLTLSEDTKNINENNNYDNQNNKFIKKIPSKLSAVMSGVCLALGIGFYYQYAFNLNENRQATNYTSDLRQHSERLDKLTFKIRSFSVGETKLLNESKDNIEKITNVLLNGGKIKDGDNDINALSDEAKEKLNEVVKDFENLKPILNIIINSKKDNEILNSDFVNLEGDLQAISNLAMDIQKEMIDFNNIKYVQELLLLSSRVNLKLNAIFSTSNFSREMGYELIKDLKQLDNIANLLENGSNTFYVTKVKDPKALELLGQLKVHTNKLNKLADKNVKNLENIYITKDLTFEISKISTKLIKSAEEINQKLDEQSKDFVIYRQLANLMLALAAFFTILYSLVIIGKNKDLEFAKNKLANKQANDEALSDLLNQLSLLNKGDFSNKIFIEDEFIGKIAKITDSNRISFAEMVSKVKQNSSNLLDTTLKNDEIATKLLKATDKQNLKIVDSIEKIGSITNDMDNAAQITWEAKEESEKSKEASREGAKLVRESIRKMDEIRNNIQESSKKIKKLGESAQSITEVTAIIQNITKQINILALNAAIQAASSGESGREFTIVAQEVQRLADDSKEATNKIENLIADIQTDTAIAISSMEKTTQEVVQGAKLTDSVGYSLKEIESFAEVVASKISEVASNMEDKSIEMANVALEIQKVKNNSEETINIVSDINLQNENLKYLSKELDSYVNKYKV